MKNVNMKITKNFVAIASKRGRYAVTRKASMTQNLKLGKLKAYI
jgi:hypothetical protein